MNKLLPYLLLLLLPLGLYWQSTNYGYVLDDQIVITDNDFTKKGFGGVWDLLSTESFTGYFGEQKNLVQGNRYRPLSLVTFAVEHGIVGDLNPWLSHFINILLYGFVGMLIFQLMGMLFPSDKSRWWLSLPFLIAIFYILHPIHSEAVANIKGRDEIMAMLFSLATLIYALKHEESGKKMYLGLGLLMYFFGLLSKENTITFLAVIPLTLIYFREYTIVQSLKKIWPYLAVTVGYIVLRFAVVGMPKMDVSSSDLMNNAFVEMSGGEKYATISFTMLKYLQLFVWPHPLSHDYYPYAIPKLGWGTWQAMLSLLVVGGLLFLAYRGWKKKSIPSYGLLFYFATITIVSNVVVNLGTFMNERFIFMSSLGLTIAVMYLLKEKLMPWKDKTGTYLAYGLMGLMAVGYAYKTIERVPDWESAITLNRSAVEGGTNSARANSFMGTALYEQAKQMQESNEKTGILIEAKKYARKAIKIHPRYGNGNLMFAGIAAELYKGHRNQTELLADFTVVANERPDLPFLKQYLDYLDTNSRNQQELNKWYEGIGVNIVQQQQINPKWGVNYLLRAYNKGYRNKQIVDNLALGYQLIGDANNAQRFRSESTRYR